MIYTFFKYIYTFFTFKISTFTAMLRYYEEKRRYAREFFFFISKHRNKSSLSRYDRLIKYIRLLFVNQQEAVNADVNCYEVPFC